MRLKSLWARIQSWGAPVAAIGAAAPLAPPAITQEQFANAARATAVARQERTMTLYERVVEASKPQMTLPDPQFPAYFSPDGYERWANGEITDSWRNGQLRAIRKLGAERELDAERIEAQVTEYILFHDGYDPRPVPK